MPGEGRRFKKGEIHNPKGRPLLNEELVAACRKLTTDNLDVLEKIIRGKSRPHEKVKALEVALDRGYGKAIQPTKELQANESYSDFMRTLMNEEEKRKDTKK